jgi:hypothetical protein
MSVSTTPARHLSNQEPAKRLRYAQEQLISGCGFVVGVLPGGQPVLVSVLAYTAAGMIYGLVISRLAARGYLPAPHSF